MRMALKHNVGLGMAVAAALTVLPAQIQAQEACEVAVEPTSVSVNAEPVAVKVAYSQAIGEDLTPELPAASGLRLLAAEADATSPMTVVLTLDTSAATAGEWELSLRGADGSTCTGTIGVAQAAGAAGG